MIELVKAKSRWLKQEGNSSQEIQKSGFYKDGLVSASLSLRLASSVGWLHRYTSSKMAAAVPDITPRHRNGPERTASPKEFLF